MSIFKSKSCLADDKPLFLLDDLQVLLDPLWIQVLGSTGLKLEGILLKILKTNSKEDSVCCVNCLNAVLRKDKVKFSLSIEGHLP